MSKKKIDANRFGGQMSVSFRDAISALKGRSSSGIVAPETGVVDIFPVSAQIKMEALTGSRKNSRPQGELQKGIDTSGGDIFIGVWTPKNYKGKTIGKSFNLFAQPKDILVGKFVRLMARVGAMPNGFNHKVAGKAPDVALYDALRTGTYMGEYFIPTKDILDMLCRDKDVGKLSGTFAMERRSGFADWYWSCTPDRGRNTHMWSRKFSNGDIDWSDEDGCSLSGRLVRAELIPPSGSSPKPQK